jgi:acetoacetyl-CoA synthetase
MSQDLFASSRLLSKPVATQNTKVEVLRRFINRKHGLTLSAYSHFESFDNTEGPYRSAEDYSELHEYSITDYAFWLDIWQFLGIISSVPPTKVRSLSAVFNACVCIISQVKAEGYIKEVPQWFPGARLNYAENMLWRSDDGIAITEANESGHVASYSYRELRELVRKFAVALKLHGLQPGDRVAGSSSGPLPVCSRNVSHALQPLLQTEQHLLPLL